jgi:hypothetical protein
VYTSKKGIEKDEPKRYYQKTQMKALVIKPIPKDVTHQVINSASISPAKHTNNNKPSTAFKPKKSDHYLVNDISLIMSKSQEKVKQRNEERSFNTFDKQSNY